MNTIQAIMTRRSYRGAYTDAPVPREDLRRILEAGLAAPSGCNLQTTSLVGVDDPAILKELHAVLNKPNMAKRTCGHLRADAAGHPLCRDVL